MRGHTELASHELERAPHVQPSLPAGDADAAAARRLLAALDRTPAT